MGKSCNAGGQALIEGILMRGPLGIVIAIRKKDGDILIKRETVKAPKNKFLKLPLVRGIFALGQSMKIGIGALNLSAKHFDVGEAEEETWFDRMMEKLFKEKAEDALIVFSMIISLLMAVGLFMVLPTVVIAFFRKFTDSRIVLSIFEGILKMTLFITYILLISKMKDIRRVFQYHGAEHKAIHCLESGKELTVENAREFTTLHPRCGTSYMFFLLALSIAVFSFVSWTSIPVRIILKLLFLPLIAGLSYEFLKYSGRSNSKVIALISRPGLLMQKITTVEPDDKQLEIAITALKEVVGEGGC